MKNKSLYLISILIVFLIIVLMHIVSPTRAEVERYFEENNCNSNNLRNDYCVYYMRRNSAMLFGQIFVPSGPLKILTFALTFAPSYVTTPFNYYNDINHGEDEFYTFTWVDTWEGRFVYNAVNGKYVKEIDDKEDPAMKYHEDSNKELKELIRLLEENKSSPTITSDYECSYNKYNCADFKTQAEAQTVMIYCGNDDIHYLDGDDEGIACEALP